MEPSDGLPTPRRYWAALSVMLTVAMSVMDSSIANVVLPTLSQQFQVPPSSTIWVTNAYQLAITVSLLPLASLGEIIGYRRIYLGGVVVFLIASLGCALSDSLPMLVLARTVQGFGAAGVLSLNAAVIRHIYPRAGLGRGIGLVAVVVSTSAAAGPTVASAVLSVASWPWLFAFNLPIGLVALALGAATLPQTPRGRHRFDILSALLSATTFGMLIGGIDGLAHGGGLGRLALQFGIAALAGLWLVRRQLNLRVPLLPVDLLRIPIFGLSICTSICCFTAQMMAVSALPFRMQADFGLSAVQVGLMMTPWPLATAAVAPIAGRLADRYPAGLLGGIGLLVFSAGLAGLALLGPGADPLQIGWRMALAGAGFGFFQSPNNRAMMGAAPRERSGGAAGMLATARLLGQTMGSAIVALLLARAGAGGPALALTIASVTAFVAAGVSSSRLLTRQQR
jgi:DHA2 family multidrug resistance protein-like MFS transporter